MNAPARSSASLLDRALRPLWHEGPGDGRILACRLAFSLPFAALAGIVYAIYFARDSDATIGATLLWTVPAFLLFVYLDVRLEPVAERLLLPERWEGGWAFDFVWETVGGGIVGFLVTRVMGAPTVSAVALASGIGAAYAFLSSRLLCGEGVGALLGLFLGWGSGGRRPSDHSLAESFAARGRIEEAAELYRAALEEDPSDAGIYLRLARLHTHDGDDPEEGIRWLKDARRKATLTPEQEELVARRIVEIWQRAGMPLRAAPELARLAERHPPETPTGQWARRELAEIKDEIAREMGRALEEDEGG